MTGLAALAGCALVAGAAGCGGDGGAHEPGRLAGRATFERITLSSPPGLSDLTVDENGELWAIPERDRVLVAITLTGHTATTRLVPLDGVPDGVDTEGMVWLGAGKFVLSTEGQDVPTAGVLWGELHAGRAVITRDRDLPSAELGVQLTNNHGAEAVCGTADELLVGIEQVGTFEDGKRWAPIAILRGTAAPVIVKFRLTSDTGKLSAMACTIEPGGDVHGWAIERHYGVSRILTFTLPHDAREVTPVIALDVTRLLPGLPNLEGIVALPDGRVILVNDNQSSKIEGPSELFVFRRLASPSPR